MGNVFFVVVVAVMLFAWVVVFIQHCREVNKDTEKWNAALKHLEDEAAKRRREQK